MMINNRIDDASKTKGRVPFLSTKYLQDMRKRCNRLFNTFTDSLSDKGINEFERACKGSSGKPFVFDDGDMRSLHFDARSMQSAMWISAPDELAFGYTRCMMAFLLQNRSPAHIVMIGLGGGSLVKFCYKYLPETRITVLEIDRDIIALRSKFSIPPDDERLKVIHIDAIDFVAQAPNDADVVLLDGFDADGLVNALITEEFYGACKKILTPTGVLVSNMWGDPKEMATSIAQLSLVFDNAVWWARSMDSCNLLSFAFNSYQHSFNIALVETARAIDLMYHLDLEKLVGKLQSMSDDTMQNTKGLSREKDEQLRSVCLDQMSNTIHAVLIEEAMIVHTRLEWMQSQDVPVGANVSCTSVKQPRS